MIVTSARGASIKPLFVAAPAYGSSFGSRIDNRADENVQPAQARIVAAVRGQPDLQIRRPKSFGHPGVEIVPAFSTFAPISATRPPTWSADVGEEICAPA